MVWWLWVGMQSHTNCIRWDFGADTIIVSCLSAGSGHCRKLIRHQNTNKHVRLVQDKPSQNGYLWSRMPLAVMNWQIEFEFKVDGSAHNIYGDGFALWISKDRAKTGPVFGSVGKWQLAFR
jgi:mannose-binding lectin 2